MDITVGIIDHRNQAGFIIAKPTVRTAVHLQHQPWRFHSLPVFVNPTSPALYAFYMMNIVCLFSQCFTLHNDVFIGLQHFSERLQIQVIVFFTDKRLNLLF